MNTNFIFCKKIKETYRNNCSDFAIAEIEEVTLHYFLPVLFGISCALYV